MTVLRQTMMPCKMVPANLARLVKILRGAAYLVRSLDAQRWV